MNRLICENCDKRGVDIDVFLNNFTQFYISTISCPKPMSTVLGSCYVRCSTAASMVAIALIIFAFNHPCP